MCWLSAGCCIQARWTRNKEVAQPPLNSTLDGCFSYDGVNLDAARTVRRGISCCRVGLTYGSYRLSHPYRDSPSG